MPGFFSTFFVNAPLLLGVMGAAVPFIIHMVYRRQAPKVQFSTLRFIRAATERTARRRRIRDWLLLLLRAAVIFLLALALAGPIFRSAKVDNDAEVSVVMVLDNSYSMAAEFEGASQYARACDYGVRLLSNLSSESQAAVVTACRPPDESLVIGALTTDRNSLGDAISRSEVSAIPGDLAAAIVRGEKLLADAPSDQREIYVFTDLQKTAWRPLPEADGSRAPVMIIVDCGTGLRENVALSGLTFAAGRPAVGVPMTLSVRVKNFGDRLREGKVALYLGGARRRVAECAIKVDPSSEAEVSFSLLFDLPGPHSGWVELEDVNDILPLDNRRYFAIDVPERLRVAVVREKQGAVPLLDESYYILPALNPGAAVASPIAPEVMLRRELIEKRLAKYRILFLLNLAELSATEQDALADYLNGGGAVVIFPGDNTKVAAWNALVKDAASPLHDLLPATFGKVLPEAGLEGMPVTLDEVQFDHPVFASFRHMPRSFFEGVVVSRYFELLVSDVSGAVVPARLSDKRPFMVEKRLREGGGVSIMFCTSATTRWSNMPTRHIYLSLLHQLAYTLARMHGEGSSVKPGEPVYFRGLGRVADSSAGETGIQVVDPRGVVTAASLQQRSDGAAYPIFKDTARAGVFTWRRRGEDAEEGAFVVNLDAGEGDLSAWSQESVSEDLLSGREAHFVRNADEAEAVVARLRQGIRLRTPLLYLVIGLLVMECLLGNQVGAGRRRREVRVTGAGATLA